MSVLWLKRHSVEMIVQNEHVLKGERSRKLHPPDTRQCPFTGGHLAFRPVCFLRKSSPDSGGQGPPDDNQATQKTRVAKAAADPNIPAASARLDENRDRCGCTHFAGRKHLDPQFQSWVGGLVKFWPAQNTWPFVPMAGVPGPSWTKADLTSTLPGTVPSLLSRADSTSGQTQLGQKSGTLVFSPSLGLLDKRDKRYSETPRK